MEKEERGGEKDTGIPEIFILPTSEKGFERKNGAIFINYFLINSAI